MARLPGAHGIALILGALLLAGCPPCGGGAAYCRDYATTYCRRLVSCGLASGARIADCETIFQRECDVGIASAEKKGIRRLAPYATSKCEGIIRGAPCKYVEFERTTCLSAPWVLIPTGQCTGVSADPCAVGTCPDSGRPTCNPGNCDPATGFCSCAPPDPATGISCPTQTCTPLLPEGAGCTTGLSCSSSVCVANTCVDASKQVGSLNDGDSCRLDAQCGANSFCAADAGALEGTCAPFTPAGSSCQDRSVNCGPAARCVLTDAGFTCLPLRDEGESCANANGTIIDNCKLGLVCVTEASGPVCEALRPQDAGCTANSQCLLGRCLGTCVPLAPGGEICTGSDYESAGSTCASGYCEGGEGGGSGTGFAGRCTSICP